MICGPPTLDTDRASVLDMADDLASFIHLLPKAELHLHIEGTLEPDLLLNLGERNHVALPFDSVEELQETYRFERLQDFLDVYYRGAAVLVEPEDFYDLTMAYLRRVAAQNVRHVEIFFDPQTHTERDVPFEVVIEGIESALAAGQRELGISSGLIPCFVRHLGPAAAMACLEQMLPVADRLLAVGLDSTELGHPPREFVAVFDRARRAGLRAVAHAGEEGPPEYVWEALNLLHVVRIDHGVRCQEDPELVRHLATTQIPLTVCPLSNVELRVFDAMEDHNLRSLLDQGLCITVNSDDPAYFGGYLEENYVAVSTALRLDRRQLAQLARNSFTASFLNPAQQQQHLAEIDALAAS